MWRNILYAIQWERIQAGVLAENDQGSGAGGYVLFTVYHTIIPFINVCEIEVKWRKCYGSARNR